MCFTLFMTCQVQETCIVNLIMYFPLKQCKGVSVICCIFTVIGGDVVIACMILNAKWHFTIVTTTYYFFWGSTTSCFLFTLVKKNPCYFLRMDNSITLHNWVTETEIYEITMPLCAGRVLPIYGPSEAKCWSSKC